MRPCGGLPADQKLFIVRNMKIFTRAVPLNCPLAEAFSAFADDPYSVFLDSADTGHINARYSYIAADPLAVLTFEHNQLICITGNARDILPTQNPFDAAQNMLQQSGFCTKTLPDLPPFQGGLIGLMGYDLARSLEDIGDQAAAVTDFPDMAVGLYPQVLAFDHDSDQAYFITQAADKNQAASLQDQWLDRINNRPASASADYAPPTWRSSVSADDFQQQVRAIQDYILQGDVFQVNLSYTLSAQRPANLPPYAHYQALRTASPAPFACYMNLGHNRALSSASPERFLRCAPDGQVETKPIKGTAPRYPDNAARDQDAQNTLRASDKDRAENIMITDLLRNDLSKSCVADSIDVPQLCAVESFSHVHHLVTTITAQRRNDAPPMDVLRHAFPGGSITGAPKIRAMQIIDTLETDRRHAYCGSMVMVGANGMMDSNILIRSLLWDADTVRFNVGGGITTLSDPAQEYQETRDKAAGILSSFTGGGIPQ